MARTKKRREQKVNADTVNACRCVYRKQRLDVGDDAQRISKREVTHTCCERAALNAEKRLDESNEDEE